MSHTWEVRFIQSGDENHILDLLRTVYKKWPAYNNTHEPMNHWKWKIKDNPHSIDNSVVTEYQNRIVACAFEYPKKVLYKGDKYLVGAMVDLAVHPDHRGRGLYNKMSDFMNNKREKMIGFTIASSNNRIVIDRMKRRKPVFYPYDIGNFVFIDDVDLHYKRSNSSLRFLKKHGYSLIRSMQSKRKENDGCNNLNQVPRFDKSVYPVLDNMTEEYDFCISYDLDYLNWRYGDPRSGNHIIIIASDSDRMLGFAVVLFKLESDYPTAIIQEIVVSQKRCDVYDSLIDKSISICRDHEINFIRTIGVSGSTVSKRLEANGFVKTELKTAVWLKPFLIGDELNNLRKMAVDRQHVLPGIFDSI